MYAKYNIYSNILHKVKQQYDRHKTISYVEYCTYAIIVNIL